MDRDRSRQPTNRNC